MTDNPKNHTNDISLPLVEDEAPFSVVSNPVPVPVKTGDNQANELAPIRQDNGRFAKGTVSPNPKGRPRGVKNRFTDTFMRTLAEDFQTNGASAFEQLRKMNPEAYLRIIIGILPKSLIKQWEDTPDVDYSEITEEEFMELLNALQRQKQMEKVIESVSK